MDAPFAAGRDIGKISKHGRFVSVNNYHYIDIDPLPNNGQPTLQAAYEVITQLRRASDAGIHILQSMVLFGNSTAFWDKNPRLLYITMIQLSDHETSSQKLLDRVAFEAEVAEAFDKAGIKRDAWCVYYSLEFCDAVFFTSESDFNQYQEVLWDLTVSPGKNGRHIVEDTISIYGVSSQLVQSTFRRFKAGKVPKFPPRIDRFRFDLSVLLGVQNANAWMALYGAVAEKYKKSGAVVFHRKFGRSDISMDFKDVDLENILYIAYLVFFGSCGDKVADYSFGSCVFALRSLFDAETQQEKITDTLSGAGDFDTGISLEKIADVLPDARDEDHFSRAAENAMDLLYHRIIGRLKKLYSPLSGYMAEIHRSLLALLKKSFSEEYYISVLPSYISYLNFIQDSLDNIDLLRRRKKDNDWQIQVDLLIYMLREYYRALTLLDHSTIHDEKKFIQAPALNAFLCEIPPKLLALYTAIGSRITEKLCDEQGENLHRYSFLMVPDFRKDVYSRTISLDQASGNQVGIIYLEERLFYEPAHIIPIMIHEIAHKVGHQSRLREERVKAIFQCIAVYLLYKTLPIQIYSMLDRMSDIMTEKFVAEFKKKEKGIPYLNTINEFIRSTCACGTVLLDSRFVEDLITAWQKDEQLRQQLLDILKEGTDTYSDEQITANRHTWSDGALYRRILQYIYEVFDDEEKRRDLACFYKCLQTAFSEAYSDLRMLETIDVQGRDGREASREYHELLSVMFSRRDCGVPGDQGDIVTYFLREDAVCRVLGLPRETESFSWSGKDPITREIISKTQEILVDYLRRCADRQHGADPQLRRYMAFENNDVILIREEIYRYRGKLKNYFKELAADQ